MSVGKKIYLAVPYFFSSCFPFGLIITWTAGNLRPVCDQFSLHSWLPVQIFVYNHLQQPLLWHQSHVTWSKKIKKSRLQNWSVFICFSSVRYVNNSLILGEEIPTSEHRKWFGCGNLTTHKQSSTLGHFHLWSHLQHMTQC